MIFARNAASSAGLRGRASQRDDVLSCPVSTSSIALCVTEMSVEPSAARSTCVRNMSRVPDEYAKSISLPMLFLNQSSGMFARFSAQSVVMMPVCGASVLSVKPFSCPELLQLRPDLVGRAAVDDEPAAIAVAFDVHAVRILRASARRASRCRPA